mmetsp:Transcript_41489/g.115315  ORF Transcript_41489/g.115315 Transcript_41489/m.115315 type:complete len:230 (+) Transcript_41489:1124-1813(+)
MGQVRRGLIVDGVCYDVLCLLEGRKDVGANGLVGLWPQALPAPLEQCGEARRGRCCFLQARGQDAKNPFLHLSLGVRMPPEQGVGQRRLLAHLGPGPRTSAASLNEAPGHDMVRKDHELLDQLVRGTRGGLLLEPHHPAVWVCAEGQVAPLQDHGASTDAQLPPGSRDLGQVPQVSQDSVWQRLLVRNPSLLLPPQGTVHLAVVEPCPRADHGPAHLGRVGLHKAAPSV